MVTVDGTQRPSRIRLALADAAPIVLVGLGMVAFAILVRGGAIASWTYINPDEVELMAQARAARLSPVPFTTWTMGTTGPMWPLTLALLGALGLPLTVAAAHLLSAILTGLIGVGVFALARRSYSTGWAVVLTFAWWAPLALVVPLLGLLTDYSALSTEYLPCALLVVVALLGFRATGGRPGWLVAGGVVGMFAVGGKFQVAPLAFVLLLLIVIRTRKGIAARLRGVGWVAIGALVPVLALALVLLVAPGVSDALIAQQFGFLGSYADGTDLASRIGNTVNALGAARWYLLAALVALIWLAMRSDLSTAIARAALALAGVAAVFAGGRGFGHYLIILIVAIGIAAALPLRKGLSPIPGRWALPITATATALAVAALATVGFAIGRLSPATPADVVAALSPDSVVRNEALARACPPGSTAVVWGWAPEIYLAQDWVNAIPYFNILGLTIDGPVRDGAEPIILSALDHADCVVEALGPPYFAVGPESSLVAVYPSSAEVLADSFSLRPGVLADCGGCSVYVRR